MPKLGPMPLLAAPNHGRTGVNHLLGKAVLTGLLWFALAGTGIAGEWELFDAQGRYQGRLEQSPDRQEIERFDATGRYLGRYERTPNGWDAFGADGSYHGRIERVPGMDEPYSGD